MDIFNSSTSVKAVSLKKIILVTLASILSVLFSLININADAGMELKFDNLGRASFYAQQVINIGAFLIFMAVIASYQWEDKKFTAIVPAYEEKLKTINTQTLSMCVAKYNMTVKRKKYYIKVRQLLNVNIATKKHATRAEIVMENTIQDVIISKIITKLIMSFLLILIGILSIPKISNLNVNNVKDLIILYSQILFGFLSGISLVEELVVAKKYDDQRKLDIIELLENKYY